MKPMPTANEEGRPSKVRVLHVLGGLDRGGVETWLRHVARRIDRDSFQVDFLVHTERKCAYDDEVTALGSRIVSCPHTRRPLRYARRFRQVLADLGPFDVVHSHVHSYSGYVLWLARQAGVPVRIAHSHNDTARERSNAGLGRRLYLQLMGRCIQSHATAGLACSSQAAAALFGPKWQGDGRWQVLLYGIDLEPFEQHGPEDRATVRAELGIEPDAFVVGHVGRFVEQKNHELLLRIAGQLQQEAPDVHLLLVGDGELRDRMKQMCTELGLSEKVTFAGLRGDVPRLMVNAMDAFLFPSLFEGLGLVLVEAQAAGLPCIFSDVVPREAEVIDPLTHRLSLSQPVDEWAEAVLDARRTGPGIDRLQALEQVRNSPYSIATSVGRLQGVYDG